MSLLQFYICPPVLGRTILSPTQIETLQVGVYTGMDNFHVFYHTGGFGCTWEGDIYWRVGLYTAGWGVVWVVRVVIPTAGAGRKGVCEEQDGANYCTYFCD